MWTCSLALAVVMLGSASAAPSLFVARSCCTKPSKAQIKEKIRTCYREGEQEGCGIEAYRIETVSGKVYCVKLGHPKLQEHLKQKKLCPSTISKKRRLDILKDVDLMADR